MRKKTNGFSLIELMIVVSIISILTVMAIPSYQQYIARARFTEVVNSTMPFKTAIAIALQSGTPFSELSSGSHYLPAEPKPTKNLAKISVKKGIIIATGTALTHHATYILSPDEDGSHWTVDGTCLQMEMCRD